MKKKISQEFGAALLNVSNGTIEDQFHSYVRPTICAKLSYYCVNLTGITQSLVNQQEPFAAVYRKFFAWIEQIQSAKGLRFATPFDKRATDGGPNATFCSWSNWDLDFYFKTECQRAGIDIPSLFKAWIDVRIMFNVSSNFHIFF